MGGREVSVPVCPRGQRGVASGRVAQVCKALEAGAMGSDIFLNSSVP